MAFTAADVKNLREMTGVGMMDCKKALTEAEGNMDKAVEILREKGLAASQKKAGRIAAEGMAYATVVNGVGVVVEVNAETDFVGKNEKFVDFVKGVAAVVAANKPADLDALMALSYGNGRTVQEEQQEMVLVIGENIKVRRFAFFTDGISVPYVHAGGKIGVLVNLAVEGIEAGKGIELGKDVAMQIAAMNPAFLDKSDVSQETLDKEKEIQLAMMANDPKMAAKPEKVKEGIVMGKLGKYYEENCLLQQAFVKENKISVEKHVAAVAKELGGQITVKAFTRFATGEGIEKKQENFAEEIAKQLGKSTTHTSRVPDPTCPALFHACAFSCARLRRAAPHGAYKRFAGGKTLPQAELISAEDSKNPGSPRTLSVGRRRRCWSSSWPPVCGIRSSNCGGSERARYLHPPTPPRRDHFGRFSYPET